MNLQATAIKHLLPLVLIAFLFPAPGRTAEQPDWEQLQLLLGQPIVAKRVVDFVKTNGMGKAVKHSSGSFSARDNSYSVMFRGNTVSTIVLHPAPWPKGYGEANSAPYSKALPGGLSPSDNRKAVEGKLGPPTQPGGDFWEHGELTIWVHFNEEKSGLQALYVSRTKDELVTVTLYAATAAEQKTATLLVQRMQTILPKGWAASYEKETSWVEFSRIEPLLRTYTRPNAMVGEKPVRGEYSVGFRIAPYVKPSDYPRIKAENKRLHTEASALCEDLSKGLGRSEDGLRSESSVEAERRALARLDQIKKSIRRLPDYHFRDISLDWEFPMFTRYQYNDVEDPVIRKECERAQRNVLRLLSAYEAD